MTARGTTVTTTITNRFLSANTTTMFQTAEFPQLNTAYYWGLPARL